MPGVFKEQEKDSVAEWNYQGGDQDETREKMVAF